MCKQKTSLPVYPSNSIEKWKTNSEDLFVSGLVFNYQDSINLDCGVETLQKTKFYNP